MKCELYEKIINERDRLKKSDPIGFKLEALSQLWVIAFNNEDCLPKNFKIENVLMSQYQIEEMLNKLEINAEVNLIGSSQHGASFNITLN